MAKVRYRTPSGDQAAVVAPHLVARSGNRAADPAAAQRWLVTMGCGLVSLLAALYVLDWPSFDVPLDHVGDNLFVSTIVKTIQETGWYGDNPRVGAPGTMQLLGFPVADNGHLLFLKILGLFTANPAAIVNNYFLLTFGLCGASAAWVLQRCQVAPLVAACGGLCYALLPYHFMRGCAHLFLGGYFGVPLSMYVLLSVTGVVRERLSGRACILWAALLPAFGGYYVSFFCYLLLAGCLLQGAAGASRRQLWREGGAILGATALGLLVNLLPSLLYRMHSDEAVKLLRASSDAEVYGLKLVQMFVPAFGHRTGWLAHLADQYNRTVPLVTENRMASMGLVLSVGFAWASWVGLRCLWGGAAASGQEARLGKLCMYNLLCFIYGTIGGLSSVFGVYVSLFLRSSNRIVVLMDFLTVLGVGWLSTALWADHRKKPGARVCAGLAAVACVGVVVWENHDTDYFPHRQANAELYVHDARFFGDLQQSWQPDSRIFQLPFVSFPEGGLGAQDYFQMRPYLHTTRGNFSFGALRGSRVAAANEAIAQSLYSDPAAFLRRLRQQRFTGLLLSRGIPTRGGAPLDELLQRGLGKPSAESPNREWVYYAL